jgi:predicted kinase
MSDLRDFSEFKRWLVNEVLFLLAKSGIEQLEWARNNGVHVDELVLQFDDALHVAAVWARKGDLKDAQFEQLRSLATAIDELSSWGDVWTEKELTADPRWQKVRDMARRIIVNLNE